MGACFLIRKISLRSESRAKKNLESLTEEETMSYLHTIGLENFRLFKYRTVFELAPITILTGINNSGKSSLIKSLQLFKSSINATGGLDELNFTGGRHNLGSFKTALNRDSESGLMKFRFDFPLRAIKEKTFLELEYRAEKGNPEFGQLVKLQVFFESGEMILRVELNPEDEHEKLIAIDFQFLNGYFSKIFTPDFFAKKKTDDDFWADPVKTNDFFKSIIPPSAEEIDEVIDEANKSSIFHYFYSQKEVYHWFEYDNDGCYQIFKGFDEFKKEDKKSRLTILLNLANEGFPVSRSHSDFGVIPILEEKLRLIKWSLEGRYESDYDIPEYPLSSIMEYVFEDFLKKDLVSSLKEFENGFTSISSLSSVRANSERLYSNNSDIVDINSLLIDFSRLTFKRNDPIETFINRSLQKFSIGSEIKINRYQGTASEIFVMRNGEDVLLADLGFGFTQLVPIILKIAVAAYRKQMDDPFDPFPSSIFLLEEPESNLHPSYQSKLAELIVDAARTFNIQFIIETHSEYLIRNLQYMTAIKTLKPQDTKIYYFHQPGSEDFEEAPYRVIEIMKDGRLSNEFGEGFFDEIPRLLAFLYNSSFNN